MAGSKHIIIIHGRSTKPSEKEKARIVRQSLIHGLNRVDPAAAARVGRRSGSDRIKLSFAYYGDISNHLILEKNPKKYQRLTGTDADHNNVACEPDGFYDDGLARLFAQRRQGKAAYKQFLKTHRDRSWMDNVASVVSAMANLTGLSDNVISAATADMGSYLLTRKWGSAVRDRLQVPLRKAIMDGDDICLVAHSMGCIVSYDVLWKFSRMSEYRAIQETGRRVTKWLTLGNPLGEPGVRDNLYDANEPEDGLYPERIVKDWVNLSAQDDFICHDPTVANDFKAMKRQGCVDSITDRKIYNFWLGAEATNPHKFYGYLDNEVFAREVTSWINAPMA